MHKIGMDLGMRAFGNNRVMIFEERGFGICFECVRISLFCGSLITGQIDILFDKKKSSCNDN